MKKLAIFLAPGFEETEALATVDLLRRAGIEVTIVSMLETLQVKGAHEITVESDTKFEGFDANGYDGIILPGGVPGVPNLRANGRLCELIKQLHKNNILICAICAAPSILAELGLLEGCNATVYPGWEVEGCNTTFTGEPVVISNNIIMGKGMGFTFQFAFAIIEHLLNNDVVKSVAAGILLPYSQK